jgi:hypothetical protein
MCTLRNRHQGDNEGLQNQQKNVEQKGKAIVVIPRHTLKVQQQEGARSLNNQECNQSSNQPGSKSINDLNNLMPSFRLLTSAAPPHRTARRAASG